MKAAIEYIHKIRKEQERKECQEDEPLVSPVLNTRIYSFLLNL